MLVGRASTVQKSIHNASTARAQFAVAEYQAALASAACSTSKQWRMRAPVARSSSNQATTIQSGVMDTSAMSIRLVPSSSH